MGGYYVCYKNESSLRPLLLFNVVGADDTHIGKPNHRQSVTSGHQLFGVGTEGVL